MKHKAIKMMINGRYGKVPSGPSAFAKFSKKCRVREGVQNLSLDNKIGRYQSEILMNMANSDNETDVFIAEKAVDMRLKGLIYDEVSEDAGKNNRSTDPTNL
jgi:hypothetical protein